MRYPRIKLLFLLLLILFVSVEVQARKRRKQSRKKSSSKSGSKIIIPVVLAGSIKHSSSNSLDSVESNQTQTRSCDIRKTKLEILKLISLEKLPAKDILSIWQANTSELAKISHVNETLSKHSLHPLNPCQYLIFSVNQTTTTVVSSAEIQQVTLAENSIDTTKGGENESRCDSQSLFSKIQKLYLSGEVSFDQFLGVYAEIPTLPEQMRALNKIISEANLNISAFLLDSCENHRNVKITQNTVPSTPRPECENTFKDAGIQKKIALVRLLEKEGLLPENSIRQIIFGQISQSELREMVIAAMIKSGRIPAYCVNQSTTISTTSTTLSEVTSTTTATSTTATTTTPSSTTTNNPLLKEVTEKLQHKVVFSNILTPTQKIPNMKSSNGDIALKERATKPISNSAIMKVTTTTMFRNNNVKLNVESATTSPNSDNGMTRKVTTTLLHTLTSLSRNAKAKNSLTDDEAMIRNFILSHLPDPIRILIEDGKMPLYIEEAIFSGSYNKSEIVKLIVGNDEVLRALLPPKTQLMIQDRPIPIELKRLFLSGKNGTEIRREIESNATLLKTIMTPSTYFFYTLFSDPRNQKINTAMSVIIIISLTAVMTSLGCTMTIDEIGKHARKPKGVIIALIAQFLLMPALAFGLTQAFALDTFAALAVLICGCCPGGNLSNIIAYALRGDMNLSILMTTCSSVLGLGFMPLNIFLYSKFIIPLDSGQVVPFEKIVLNIALTIFPVCIGIVIRHYRPSWVTYVMRVGAIILILSSITIAVLAGTMFGTSFFGYFPLSVVACCAILPLAGYLFGFLLGWLAREPLKCTKTISVETGCQNVQLCTTVLKLAFDPILIGVLFLMPMVYMCFQIAEALLMVLSFRFYNYMRNRNKKTIEEDSIEKKISEIDFSGTDDERKVKAHEASDPLLLTKSDPPSMVTFSEAQSKGIETRPLNDSHSKMDTETVV